MVALFHLPAGFNSIWSETGEQAGFALLILAALGRLWAYAHIGGRKNRELCTTGPYALCRNPLYFFSFIGLCGAALALQDPWLCAIAPGLFLAYYAAVIRAEEARLLSLFGSNFSAYCSTVPRFWPRRLSPGSSGEILISDRLFLRTLGEVFWFLAAIVVIELIEVAKHDGWWSFVG